LHGFDSELPLGGEFQRDSLFGRPKISFPGRHHPVPLWADGSTAISRTESGFKMCPDDELSFHSLLGIAGLFGCVFGRK
jgi:hypothetical protein